MSKTKTYNWKWKALSFEEVESFSGFVGVTGEVLSLDFGAIPSGHQEMEGLSKIQWSGYANPGVEAFGVTGIGELVLTRIDGGKSKAYAYPVGKSGESLFLGREWKGFDSHHSSIHAPASVDDVFWNIPWPSGYFSKDTSFRGICGPTGISASVFAPDVPPTSGSSDSLWMN